MKVILLSLYLIANGPFTVYSQGLQSVATNIGAYGQDCTPDQGDHPIVCPSADPPIKDLTATNGKITCGINHDCCMCRSMTCGNQANGGCDELGCGADWSCYGVQNINIYGEPNGALVNCNGDGACQKTSIFGRYIKEIACSGDDTCSFSSWSMTCTDSRCNVRCSGSNACQGVNFNIQKTMGLFCGTKGCFQGTFSLMDNYMGAVECGASEACKQAVIAITEPSYVSCGAFESCRGANIIIFDPQPVTKLFCDGPFACKDMTITFRRYKIQSTVPIKLHGEIMCNGPNSCENLKVIMEDIEMAFDGVNALISCNGMKACQNSQFILQEKTTSGSLELPRVRCSTPKATFCDQCVTQRVNQFGQLIQSVAC